VNLNSIFVCDSCVFADLCTPFEKDNRNFDGMCDDFSFPGSLDNVEDGGVSADDANLPFLVGEK
jgi:hypothetical protein